MFFVPFFARARIKPLGKPVPPKPPNIMVAPSDTSATTESIESYTLFFTALFHSLGFGFVQDPLAVIHLVAGRHFNQHSMGFLGRNKGPLQPRQMSRPRQ